VVTSVQGATLFVSKVTCAQQQLELFDRALVCAQVSSFCVTFGLVFGFLVLASCNSWRSLSNDFSPYAHRCEVRSEKLMYSTAIKKLSAPRTRRAQAPQRLTEINLPDKMKIAPFAQREPRSAVASSLSTPGLLYKSSPFVRQKFTFHRISLIPGTRVQFPHPL
jgi:hypothetical protein